MKNLGPKSRSPTVSKVKQGEQMTQAQLLGCLFCKTFIHNAGHRKGGDSTGLQSYFVHNAEILLNLRATIFSVIMKATAQLVLRVCGPIL